jgi:phenylalanyl-tRNA synthetase beta chain
LHGFDRIPAALPAVEGPDAPELPPHALRECVREVLAGAGWAEAIDWAFVDAMADARFAPLPPSGSALALVNPLSERHALMRRSLLPGLLEAASFNRRHDLPAVRLFEIGHVFWRGADGAPAEADHLALVCGGRLGNPWQRSLELDLFDLKGAAEVVAAALGRELVARPAEVRGLVPGRSAELCLAGSGEVVGVIGQVAEEAGESYGLFVAELSLAPFLPLPPPPRVEIPPRLPGIEVDLTLTLPEGVGWSAIVAAVEAQQVPDLARFGLKDRYQGEGVPAGAVNTTLWFRYQAERTLTLEQVNRRQAELAAALLARLAPSSR